MDEVRIGAEEVATKDFPVGLRGYRQHEVRAFLAQVAAELAAAKERERLQRERLATAEAPVGGTLSGADLEAALGQEAGKVLHAARQAAAEMRARAEEQVERLVREASGEGNRAQQEAESLLARRTEEAEGVAEEILSEARRRAEAEVEEAKAQGREMVAEAQAVRERVLKDLARRRRLAHQQLEQLRAGRERLLEAYRVVRSTLDEATRELSVVEAEARAAAETASLRAGARPETSVEEMEAELSAARDLGLELLSAPAAARGGAAIGNGNGNGSRGGGGRSTPTLPDDGGEVEPPGLVDEAPAVLDPVAPVEEVPPPDLLDPVDLADLIEPAAPAESVEPLEAAGPAEPVGAEPAAEPVDEVAEADSAGPEPAESSESAAPAEAASPTATPAVASGVEELFARLRAERAEDLARAEDVLSEALAGPPDAAPDEGAPAGAAAPAAPSAPTDDDHLQVRDAELDPLERSLAKSLKRALADEQNEVLDSLRRCRGDVSLADLLPGPTDHTARYLAVAVPDLKAAAASGAGQAPPPSVDDLAAEMAAEMAADLRARLQRALEAADGDERALTEGVSVAYREWKSTRTEPLVRHHLAAAHVRGRFAAAPHGLLCWVVDDDEGPCPDCDDNALAGPTPKGTPFPTGQHHPPAHIGCRCTIVVTA